MDERAVDRPTQGQGDEISLVEIVTIILRYRKVVMGVLVLCVGISLVQALRRPTLFTASASFFPEDPSATPGGGASALAQQFGIAVNRGNARTPQFYAGLIVSRELLRETVSQRFILSGDGAGAEGIDLITHFEVRAATESGRTELAIEGLKSRISVSISTDTGIVYFSVTTSDPVLSTAVAASILESVHGFDRTTRQSQASAERRFSEERMRHMTDELRQAEDSLKNFLMENRVFSNSPQLQFENDRLQRIVAMRQALVTSLAEAFERARIEEVRNTPLITVVEPPREPAFRNGKGRIRTVAVGIVIGLVLGALAAFLSHYRKVAAQEEDPHLDELRSILGGLIGSITQIGRRTGGA